jgi:hypothetical protein
MSSAMARIVIHTCYLRGAILFRRPCARGPQSRVQREKSLKKYHVGPADKVKLFRAIHLDSTHGA